MRATVYLALTLAAAIFAAPAAAADRAAEVVKVEGGQIRGRVAGDVLSFKGIPFAAPPVGDLRWRSPQPVRAWSGVRDAGAYGHDCMQVPFPSDAAPLGTAPDEDCLVLNVWRPAKASGKLPVLVWIYGGGFVNGGSSPAVYDGSAFARKGLVLVSFNYRLGRFGYFAHPALTAAGEGPVGNFGLMDQHAALQWVKRNIAAFRGDPDQVTVFGESAGGMSITDLMGAPAARGLFRRAAIMSGGGRGPEPLRRMSEDLPDLPSAETIGVNFARANGITSDGAEALKALRALPAPTVAKGVSLAELFAGPQAGPPTWTGPFQDGVTLVGANPDLLARGAMATMPVMVGATGADIGFLAARSKDELFGLFGADRDKARAAFDPSGDAPLAKLTQTVGRQSFMTEPARYLASEMTAAGQPAWHYRFSYVAQSMRREWQGAPHATDIPYIFDTVAAKYGDKLKPEDEAIARAFHAYLVNFAKTGDPNGAGLPAWPRYEPKTDALLDLTMDRGPVVGPDPLKPQLDLVAARATSVPASPAR
jgi:para-nitrobenzyl esterase